MCVPGVFMHVAGIVAEEMTEHHTEHRLLSFTHTKMPKNQRNTSATLISLKVSGDRAVLVLRV